MTSTVCMGLSWYNLISPPLSTSTCLHLCPPTVDVCLPSVTTLKCTCSVLVCHAQHWRGSRCRKAQSDTQVELAYDSVEGSMYVIGTWTATVSRTLAWT